MTDQMVRCEVCRLEHPTGAGFTRKKGRVMCGVCSAAEKRRRAERTAWLIWALFAMTGLAWLTDTPYAVRYVLTRASAFYVVAFSMTAIHEGAHALAAATMGIGVRSVQIGAEGPVAFSATRGLFSLQIRVLPLGGATRFIPATRALRTRHLAAIAAGPVAELLVVALAWSWDADGWMLIVRNSILLVGAFNVVLNLLIPLRSLGNDSSQLIQLLTMGDDEVAITKESARHEKIVHRLHEHEKGSPLSHDELEAVRQYYLERLADPARTGDDRAIMANNLSAVDVMTERPDLLAEADELSAEAYGLRPIPAIAANRGSVLVALGRDDEAVPLISRALPELDASSRDSAHADLALVAVRRGDLFEARRHLTAVSAGYDGPHLGKALRLLGPAELSNILSFYWTDGQAPSEVAAMIRNDAGADAASIAHVLSTFAQTADTGQVDAVFVEQGRHPSDARAAVEHLAASLEES